MYLNFRLLLFRTFFSYFPILDLLISDQINFYLGFYYLVHFLYFIFSVISYKQHALIVIERFILNKNKKEVRLCFSFGSSRTVSFIRDSSLWSSNFIPSVHDSIIIIGSRSVTYTFGLRFTYKCWVRVLSKSEFQLSCWAIIPILFVGSQSMSIEVRINKAI